MPRRIRGVKPRVKDARAYEEGLRRVVLDPLFRNFYQGLGEASSLNQVWYSWGKATAAAEVSSVPFGVVEENFGRVRGYHDERIKATFRSALGVDISMLMLEDPVQIWMNQKVVENVDLIKTIPRRAHDSLVKRLQTELVEAPFDRERLSVLLREEYGSSGYNLRRLARDQTNKAIGNLTQLRHQQLQIEGYRWSTSADLRVRPTHQENEGFTFRWAEPPPTGPPGYEIQCRCVAVPVLLQADIDRFVSMLPRAA